MKKYAIILLLLSTTTHPMSRILKSKKTGTKQNTSAEILPGLPAQEEALDKKLLKSKSGNEKDKEIENATKDKNGKSTLHLGNLLSRSKTTPDISEAEEHMSDTEESDGILPEELSTKKENSNKKLLKSSSSEKKEKPSLGADLLKMLPGRSKSAKGINDMAKKAFVEEVARKAFTEEEGLKPRNPHVTEFMEKEDLEEYLPMLLPLIIRDIFKLHRCISELNERIQAERKEHHEQILALEGQLKEYKERIETLENELKEYKELFTLIAVNERWENLEKKKKKLLEKREALEKKKEIVDEKSESREPNWEYPPDKHECRD